MNKTVFAISALAGCLVAALAVAPAQAFHSSKSKSAHKHHHGFKHAGRYYEARYRFGARGDCAQLRRRAHLTGSSYWSYAAKRCHADRYYFD